MRRIVATAITAVLVGAALPAGAGAAAAEPGVVTAAGTVTVETSRTAKVRLEVPAAATLDLSTISVTGEGGYVGLMFTEPRTRSGLHIRTLRYPPTLGQPAHTSTSGQKALADRSQPATPLDEPDVGTCTTCAIAAGEYDLYVIADGSPVTASLTLQGLGGSVALADDALQPVASTQIDGEPYSLSADLLMTGYSKSSFCCQWAEGGLAFPQVATEVVPQTVSIAARDFCVKTASSEECDLGQSGHRVVAAGFREVITSYPSYELPESTWVSTWDSLTYHSGTNIDFSIDFDVLLFDW